MGISSFFKNFFVKAEVSTNAEAHIEKTDEQTQQTEVSYIEKVETFAEETFSKVKEASEPILEDAVEYASQAKDIVSEYVEKATHSINVIIDSVKEMSAEEESKPIYDTVVDDSEKAITSDE
ncbi:YtxH domain-containing protein [Flavobacterium sp.]|uniref:YtxH domain-containing protein n=1 Tax=Flavobacterium sp. TaxID=239 RepID=UPI003265561A